MNITFNINNIQTPAERDAFQHSQNLMKEVDNRAGSLMNRDNQPGFDTNIEDGFVEFRDPDLGNGKVLFDSKTRELKEMETFDGYCYVKFQKTAEEPGKEELYYEMTELDENSDPHATFVEKVQFNKGTGTITYFNNH